MCDIGGIRNDDFSDFKSDELKIAVSFFWADGCLCLLFAVLTHFKYTRVNVLNYTVCTTATSNLQWIWFFIFTAVSSIMSGLDIWLNKKEHSQTYPEIVDWFASLLSVMSLLFAVKYQWQYREEAYSDMATTSSVEETTPILIGQNRIGLSRPSKADVFFVGIFLLSVGFSIAAWVIGDSAELYWIGLALVWFLQVVVLIMIFIIHYNVTQNGPSIFIKCVLMLGVIFHALSVIPTYIWVNCILKDDGKHDVRDIFYDGVSGLILISHVAFFFVMRTEFLRLRDVAIWNVAERIHSLESSNNSRIEGR